MLVDKDVHLLATICFDYSFDRGLCNYRESLRP